MKKVIFIFAIILTALTSCEKEEITVSETSKPQNKEILTFATQEEFEETLAKVNAMTKEERLVWEKEQGFKSFGTICDEFYETIDPESFKSSEEVKAFAAKHSDKIEFYTSSDGEIYCVTKNFKNQMRYLTNKNQTCEISNKIISFAKTDSFSSKNLIQKSPRSTMSNISEYDRYEEGEIGSDTYRTHVWLETYFLSSSSYGLPGSNKYVVFVELKNFSRSLGIWWLKDASTRHRGYSFEISDGKNSYAASSNYWDGTQAITETISQNKFNKIFDTDINKTPYFKSFEGEVKTTFYKKKNWFSSTILSTTVTVNLNYNN